MLELLPRRVLLLSSVMLAIGVGSACVVAEAEMDEDPRFPLESHSLLPLYGPNTGHVSSGRATGDAPHQPIMFSHALHSGELQIDCQYCHSEARKSRHAGAPPVQTCMGCHQHCAKHSPEVQKIHLAWCGKPDCGPALQRGEFGQVVADPLGTPIEWNKVHDLPDFVHFEHSRHIKGGVQCTECHGQVQLQGQYEARPIPNDPEGRTYRHVDQVMVREATLQMGWCLDCHASHPSINQNYGDQADLRRAELKDCWTCHK